MLLVDPYLDRKAFDLYVRDVEPGIQIRLLVNKFAGDLEPLIRMFEEKPGADIEVRVSNQLHDRVLFVDQQQCWVIGQSLKDAAKQKTTYIAPLGSDVVPDKLAYYEQIWNQASKV